jgi:RNase H-like domain found in reverse transcriptase
MFFRLRGMRRRRVHVTSHKMLTGPTMYVTSSFSWSTCEKEAYPIVQTFERLDYLLVGKTTDLHTDHRNLDYIFDPYGQNPTVARHVASKLMRWAFKLCAFRYIIHHVPGEANVWADLLTRWAVRYTQKLTRPTISLFLLAPVAGADELAPETWPSGARVMEAQKHFQEKTPEGMLVKDGLMTTADNRTWIPPSAAELMSRYSTTSPNS